MDHLILLLLPVHLCLPASKKQCCSAEKLVKNAWSPDRDSYCTSRYVQLFVCFLCAQIRASINVNTLSLLLEEGLSVMFWRKCRWCCIVGVKGPDNNAQPVMFHTFLWGSKHSERSSGASGVTGWNCLQAMLVHSLPLSALQLITHHVALQIRCVWPPSIDFIKTSDTLAPVFKSCRKPSSRCLHGISKTDNHCW